MCDGLEGEGDGDESGPIMPPAALASAPAAPDPGAAVCDGCGCISHLSGEFGLEGSFSAAASARATSTAAPCEEYGPNLLGSRLGKVSSPPPPRARALAPRPRPWASAAAAEGLPHSSGGGTTYARVVHRSGMGVSDGGMFLIASSIALVRLEGRSSSAISARECAWAWGAATRRRSTRAS